MVRALPARHTHNWGWCQHCLPPGTPLLPVLRIEISRLEPVLTFVRFCNCSYPCDGHLQKFFNTQNCSIDLVVFLFLPEHTPIVLRTRLLLRVRSLEA